MTGNCHVIYTLSQIVQIATKLGPTRIAVVEASEPDVLASLREAEAMGLAEPTLIGDSARIEAVAKSVGYSISPSSLVVVGSEEEAISKATELVRTGEADLIYAEIE